MSDVDEFLIVYQIVLLFVFVVIYLRAPHVDEGPMRAFFHWWLVKRPIIFVGMLIELYVMWRWRKQRRQQS